MNLLLDTHIFLWLNEQPEKLSANILSHCEDTNNTLFLSHVSPWEIQIKHQLGKLELDESLQAMIETQQQDNDLQLLPIKLAHIYALAQLPFHHRDPFDRLLIAQAMDEEMSFVSVDGCIADYSVDVVS
jgi:PIN domain nuclease of toxin-antitoxin system